MKLRALPSAAASLVLLVAPAGAAQAAGVSDGVPVTGSPGVASAALVANGLGALPAVHHERSGEAEQEREGDVKGPGAPEGGRPADLAQNPDVRATPHPRVTGRRVGATVLTPASGFDGPSYGGAGSTAFPPDTQGDVGPTQYIVAINGRFRSYAKATGTADGALDVDPDQFFASAETPPTLALPDNFTSDPHIRYDRLSHRWFIVMIDVPSNFALSQYGTGANSYMLAVSSGPTITGPGDFTLYRWSEDLAGGADGQFADYPTLGIDRNALYIGGNMFGAVSGSYTGTRAYVVRKSSVTGAGPIVVTKFRTGDSNAAGTMVSGLFTPQGVDDRSGTSSVGWFAGVDAQVTGRVDFLKITDPGGTPTMSGINDSGSLPPALTPTLPVDVPGTAYPRSVPHKGNTDGADGNLDALDDRLFSANLRAGHIWTAHSIGVNAAGTASSAASARDAARWYDFDVSSGTPALGQSGTVFDSASSNPLNYTIPTVNVSGQGIVAMGGTVAGANAYVNAWFASRRPSDAVGAMDPPTLTTSAAAAYNPAGDTPGNNQGPRRWGDYSFVSVDPDDDMTMWSIQEYTASANVWGTRITKLKAPAPAATTTAPAKLTIGPAVSHITIAGSGFFDPGAAFPNRLTVTSNCGATVTVTSVSASSVAADVVAPGAGTCTFTVTNPDGQSTVSSSAVPVTNHAPAAAADSGTTAQDTALDGASVLGNDTDADSDALTAALATPPAHGTVTVASSGTYHYVPAAGYSGSDAFTYTAGDGLTSSVPATVSLTVTPAPVVTTPTTPTTPTTTTTTTPTTTTPTLRPGTAPTCTVPAVKGLTSTKAKAKLAAAGCTAVTVKRVRSTKARPNRSLQTVPAAGTVVKPATPVTLQVTYPLCKVPKVTGLTLAKAKRKLKAAACFKVTVKRVAGGRTGRVAKTSPKAGRTVKASGRVTVSVGR